MELNYYIGCSSAAASASVSFSSACCVLALFFFFISYFFLCSLCAAAEQRPCGFLCSFFPPVFFLFSARVHDEELHCEWGLISRAGWAVVDDTTNYGLTPGAEWWDSPNTDTSDLYFFGHGLDYKVN